MEHFIETVRRYPCLWNTSAIEYRDQELKDAAWAEVMKETDLSSVKEVKLKWKKLRDSYRDALKRQSEMLAKDPGGGGGGGKRTYPWKYMSQMQFLQPYMNNRRKARESPPAAACPAAAPDRSSDSECSSGASSGRRRGARRRAREYSPPPAPDPLDIFFNGMCQSTKRFPFHAQIKIKKTLFGAVIEAEEALLADRREYAALWARARPAPPPPLSSSSSDAPDDKPS